MHDFNYKAFEETGKMTMHDFNYKAFEELEKTIKDCAYLAAQAQKDIRRFYKEDGSVLTQTDLRISQIVEEAVQRLFSSSTFICEESPVIRKSGEEYIFVLDPIDGTDVYSQGLPSFAIALGILDCERKPVGALIAAPRFGVGREDLFLSLIPGGKLRMNGEDFSACHDKDEIEQVTIGSKELDRLDFSRFDGKVRIFGSSILHIVSPVIFPSIQGCINQPSYVWDIAASHAVLISQGMDISYFSGRKFEYTDEFLFEKKKYSEDIYCGTWKGIENLRRLLPPRS